MATKKFSPAQLAAQKLFAERARAGTLKQRKKRKPNPGLYDNINAKRKRIAAGSGEKMRKPGQAGRPTAEAFEQSAMTAKRNPSTNTGLAIYLDAIALGETYSESKLMEALEHPALSASDRTVIRAAIKGAAYSHIKLQDAAMKIRNYMGGRKTNPDKAKPRAYVKRASKPKYNEAAVNKAIAASRSKISAAEGKTIKRLLMGRSGNPTAMMTGYQVICMHPKKHVVGIFKTMAEAKLVARAMADAKGVAYGVKTVKVHKAHFAV